MRPYPLSQLSVILSQSDAGWWSPDPAQLRAAGACYDS